MVGSQHGMNGVSQLVRQGRHIARAALIVGEDPGSPVRRHAPAEGSSPFPLAYLTIQVVLRQDPPCQPRHAGVKASKGVQDHFHRVSERIGLLGTGHRGVEVVASQSVHAQPGSFEAEETVKETAVALAYLQQRVHHIVWDVVVQVANRHRSGEVTQVDLLVAPVAYQRLVYLTQNRAVLPVNPVQLLVGTRPQVRVRVAHVGCQLITGQFLHLAIHFQAEDVTIGDQIVQCVQGVDPGDILDVDNPLLGFGECVWLEMAHLLQPIAKIPCLCHQPLGIVILQAFPPQLEEQRAILQAGHKLIHPGDQALSGLVLSILRKP